MGKKLPPFVNPNCSSLLSQEVLNWFLSWGTWIQSLPSQSFLIIRFNIISAKPMPQSDLQHRGFLSKYLCISHVLYDRRRLCPTVRFISEEFAQEPVTFQSNQRPPYNSKTIFSLFIRQKTGSCSYPLFLLFCPVFLPLSLASSVLFSDLLMVIKLGGLDNISKWGILLYFNRNICFLWRRKHHTAGKLQSRGPISIESNKIRTNVNSKSQRSLKIRPNS
jgi:hypothetical protein